ncbi:hypothetical protein ACGFNU_24480 [Spirillospora sp. NPDC048911]|uniref:hypothetical protein n=1 Tax=Spirillospora sp. NPDC048911 TaxID=3364527 RepID=UPI003715D1C5
MRDLAEAAELVTSLALLRDPAAYRPWREPALTPDQRAELDHAARAERAERVADAPGEHTDAARPEILDALSGVLWRAESLAWHLSRAAWCPVLPLAAADADPRPYLARAVSVLPTAVTGWQNGTEIAWWAADEAAAMLADLAATLGLMTDGQHLRLVCPWCGGRTEQVPTGGAWTWRVRHLPGDLVAIVCEGGMCEPPSKDVGTWWRGCPAWPLAEWEWLARRIERNERMAS